MAGTTRALVNNMVTGVSRGLREELELVGVGYRAQAQGKVLNLSLGFSHPVDYEVPDGHHDRDAEPDADRRQGHRQAEGRPGAAEIRASVRPSPTRARACATPTSASSQGSEEEVGIGV